MKRISDGSAKSVANTWNLEHRRNYACSQKERETNKKTGEKTADKLFLNAVRIVPNLCKLYDMVKCLENQRYISICASGQSFSHAMHLN